MVRRRHRAQGRQVRATSCRPARRGGRCCAVSAPGSPPLHRFRLGLEFAISGHRDVDGMIDQHAALARELAAQLGLPGGGAATRWARPTSGGTARAGRASSPASDDPDRGTGGAARRVHGGRPPRRWRRGARARWPRSAQRQAVRPRAGSLVLRGRRRDPRRARHDRDVDDGDRQRARARRPPVG